MSEKALHGLVCLIITILALRKAYVETYPPKEKPKKRLSDYFTAEERAKVKEFVGKVMLNGIKEVKEEKGDE